MPEQQLTEPPQNGAETLRRSRLKAFYFFAAGLSLCFATTIYGLLKYALTNDFFSYIPLIPVISIYLIRSQRKELPNVSGGGMAGAVVLALAGAASLAGWRLVLHAGWKPEKDDYLTAMTAAYLFFMVAGLFALFGSKIPRSIAFALALLVFTIPIPSPALDAIDLFFQKTSAMMTSAMLTAAGMPNYRDHLTIHMPGYALVVTKECSGIHSTIVLFITGLLAGHLFLRSKWRRLVLVLFVIPLAILRNGFRIAVIGELCVRVSHDMIDSPVHRHGGPIFFALSLVPFFYLLYLLRKSEARPAPAAGAPG